MHSRSIAHLHTSRPERVQVQRSDVRPFTRLTVDSTCKKMHTEYAHGACIPTQPTSKRGAIDEATPQRRRYCSAGDHEFVPELWARARLVSPYSNESQV